jgi:hypothetical protein
MREFNVSSFDREDRRDPGLRGRGGEAMRKVIKKMKKREEIKE